MTMIILRFQWSVCYNFRTSFPTAQTKDWLLNAIMLMLKGGLIASDKHDLVWVFLCQCVSFMLNQVTSEASHLTQVKKEAVEIIYVRFCTQTYFEVNLSIMGKLLISKH